MAELKTLSFAAASGRVGVVLLIGDRLVDWRMSRKASTSPGAAAVYATRLIEDLRPDVVVTEAPGVANCKGEHSKAIVAAIASVARERPLLDISTPRVQRHADKYAEAAALAERWPDIAARKPKKRRFFDTEPRSTIMFEALALAQAVLVSSDSRGA